MSLLSYLSVCVLICFYFFFFFKQKTAYEMRISDWSSDVCSSDLVRTQRRKLSGNLAGDLRDRAHQRLATMNQVPGDTAFDPPHRDTRLIGVGDDATDIFQRHILGIDKQQEANLIGGLVVQRDIDVFGIDRKSTRLTSSH